MFIHSLFRCKNMTTLCIKKQRMARQNFYCFLTYKEAPAFAEASFRIVTADFDFERLWPEIADSLGE